MLLSDLIESVPEAGLELLNPGVSLERSVLGIDSSETPDIAQYLAPETLLLTTAMVYRDDQQGLAQLIRQLDEAQAAGCAIKLGRFIERIDPAVLEAADECGFPLFRIPADATLGVTYHKLQSHIWGIETRQIYDALDIQKTMTRMLLSGASLSDLLQCFATALGRDVFYYDYFFDVRAAHCGVAGKRPEAAFVQELGSLLRATHREKPIVVIDEFFLETSRGEFSCIVAPVEAGLSYPSFIAVLERERVPDPFLYMVTEQAGTVFSYHKHNLQRLVESEWHATAEHFQRLLHLKSRSDLSFIDTCQLAPQFPLADLGSYQIVAAAFKPLPQLPAYLAGRDHFALVYRWLKKQTAPLKESCVLIPLPERGLIVLLIRESKDVLPLFLQGLSEGLADYVELELCFGVGTQTHRLESLDSSWSEATTALDKALEDPERVSAFYTTEGIRELLQFAPENHIRHYCTHILGELAYPGDEHFRSLRETLEAFLDCQCDITHAAKALFIHRNTVRYRIAKITDLLGLSLDDPDNTMQLRLAIYLSREER